MTVLERLCRSKVEYIMGCACFAGAFLFMEECMSKILCLLCIILLCCIAFVGCGEEETEHVHDYKLAEDKAATCTTMGGKLYRCECGDVQMRDIVDAFGHVEVKYKSKEPTCTEKGWEEHTWCPVCGFYGARTDILPLGHDIVSHEGRAATCMEKGWDAYETCSRCDYTTYNELPLVDHVYDNVVVTEPTTTERGYTTYSCDCGDSYVTNYTEPSSYSLGLKYKLSSDGTGYVIEDEGTCLDENIIIPELYNGLPVIGIDSTSFWFCSFIKSVYIPANVIYIGEWAFSNCTSLETVTFADNSKLQSIGEKAFSKTGIATISLPDTVSELGISAFERCESLTSIRIPAGVTQILNHTFARCYNLTTIIIPTSVLYVGTYAFESCENATVYYEGAYSEWENIYFDDYYSNDLARFYRYYYRETPPTNDDPYWHYNSDGEIEIWDRYYS